MNADSIRETALARGLTAHQADIAAALIPFIAGVARIERGIRALMSHRQPGAEAQAVEWSGLTRRLDMIVGKASNTVAAELSRGADALGLALSVPQGDRLYDLMLRLAYLPPDDGQRVADVIHALMDLCRTATATLGQHAAEAAKAGA